MVLTEVPSSIFHSPSLLLDKDTSSFSEMVEIQDWSTFVKPLCVSLHTSMTPSSPSGCIINACTVSGK